MFTLRPAEELDVILAQTELPPGLFAAQVTQSDVGGGLALHSEALTCLVERLGVAPENILVVADTEFILRPAQALGMVRCGVLGGLGQPQDLHDVDLLIDSLQALREYL